MVRKISPGKALDILHFTPNYAATDLTKAIQTALASAKQKGLDEAVVSFKSIEINEGPVMKRFRPASKGRALPFKRKMSHIKIILTDDLSNKPQVTSDKPKNKDAERKGSTGQSSNEPESKKGGRTGLSKT